jgi:hypothetical protein
MRAKPWEVPDGLWERIEPLLSKKLHGLLLAELHAGDQLQWEHAVADSSRLQAKKAPLYVKGLVVTLISPWQVGRDARACGRCGLSWRL